MKIKAGTILVLEHGEYSDYGFDGPFKVLKDFDQAEIAEVFREQWKPAYEGDTYISERDFIAWLSKEFYIKDIAGCHHWHIGSYGFQPEIQSEP